MRNQFESGYPDLKNSKFNIKLFYILTIFIYNILSYPEQFWITVLKNNNIEYIPNKPIKQENNISNYFLDFYIEHNGRKIDLEIDGKQHLWEDRKEHDKLRDEYIKSKGIEVYRIPWNEINSENGKQLMKEKIDKFIKYYNDLN